LMVKSNLLWLMQSQTQGLSHTMLLSLVAKPMMVTP
jgi:hypothetical protein